MNWFKFIPVLKLCSLAFHFTGSSVTHSPKSQPLVRVADLLLIGKAQGASARWRF